jgi:hypothetical protein
MNINKRRELLLAATAGADCGEKCMYNERHDYYYFMQSRQRERERRRTTWQLVELKKFGVCVGMPLMSMQRTRPRAFYDHDGRCTHTHTHTQDKTRHAECDIKGVGAHTHASVF